jgi:hypothetical protein
MCLFHAVVVCVVPGPWCRVRRKLDIRGAYWFFFGSFCVFVLLERERWKIKNCRNRSGGKRGMGVEWHNRNGQIGCDGYVYIPGCAAKSKQRPFVLLLLHPPLDSQTLLLGIIYQSICCRRGADLKAISLSLCDTAPKETAVVACNYINSEQENAQPRILM